MPAADGVDARARRVAARLLASRSRRYGFGRSAQQGELPGGDDGSPRHLAGGHPAGAARIAKSLKALEADGWVSLTQVQRPGGPDAGPRIDHLVIGPGGVVVLDSRVWVGRVEVSRGVVQQNGFWRERETAAVAHAAGTVAALLLPQHRTAVHAFVCIAQHDLTEHVVAPGVHVVGVSGLARSLRALPHRLHPAEVLHLNTVLRHMLVDAESPEQLTTAELYSVPYAVDAPGAHREPTVAGAGVSGLFVPVAGSTLRSVARSAARRQRPQRPWWRNPRVLVPRVLLAALVLAGLATVGPGLLRSIADAVGAPAATVLTPASSGDPSGDLSDGGPTVAPAQPSPNGSPNRNGFMVPPVWSGGSAPIQPIPPAAATAREQPLGSMSPTLIPRSNARRSPPPPAAS